MESITPSLPYYLMFIGIASLTGTVYWVRGKFRIGAVLAMILSLAGPIIGLFLFAQRETSATAYEYMMAEMGPGNFWASFAVFIHIYLLGWLLFLLISILIKIFRSPFVKEKLSKLFSRAT